jgi:hypothetical protein
LTTPRSSQLALSVAILVAAGGARAQRGVDAETFRPSLDGFGLTVTERAETSKQWDFGFKLVGDFAKDPLRLALHDAGAAPGARVDAIEWQTTLHFGFHLGLADWLELALEVPVSAQSYGALYGSPFDDKAVGPTGFYAGSPRTNIGPPSAGVLDPRLALKARARRVGPVGFALVVATTVPIGDDSAFLGEGGFTFRPAGVFDVTAGRFTLALNVGAIIRSTNIVYDPLPEKSMKPAVLIGVGHELSGSLGVAVRAASWLSISAEAYGLLPLTKIADRDGSDVSDPVLGVLGALKFSPRSDFALTVGGGAGLLDGRRHDTFRVFLGLGWTPDGGKGGRGGGTGDRDGDGIPDGVDLCPDAPEDKDGFEDSDGCPDPDNDGDGVPDVTDKCPAEAEDLDGWKDEDGCIDPDNDGDGVPDAPIQIDRCPNEPEDKDGFEDDDGCPDPDNDGDGIPDVRDRCPNEPETDNGIDDDDGCPDGFGERGGAGGEGSLGAPVVETLLFERWKPRTPPRMVSSSYAGLDRIARLLKLAGRRAQIVGVVEAGDPPEAAAGFAAAVREALVKRGADVERIEVTTRNAPRPARGRAKKADRRRVEVTVTEARP